MPFHSIRDDQNFPTAVHHGFVSTERSRCEPVRNIPRRVAPQTGLVTSGLSDFSSRLLGYFRGWRGGLSFLEIDLDGRSIVYSTDFIMCRVHLLQMFSVRFFHAKLSREINSVAAVESKYRISCIENPRSTSCPFAASPFPTIFCFKLVLRSNDTKRKTPPGWGKRKGGELGRGG